MLSAKTLLIHRAFPVRSTAWLIAVASGMWLTSCSPPNESVPIDSTRVTGTFSGNPVSVGDTVGLYGVQAAAGTYAGAMISNGAGLCGRAQAASAAPDAGCDSPNATRLTLLVSTTGVTVPGFSSYAIGMTTAGVYSATATFDAIDAQCSVSAMSAGASGGTIRLEGVTPELITGTYDLTFPSGDHLSGQFKGPVCDFDWNALRQNGFGGCKP